MYSSLQSSIMNSLKDSSQQLILQSNCKNRLENIAKLKNLLVQKKNTIFLFTIEKSMGKLLANLGKWMLGADLKRNKKFEYSVNDSNIEHTTLKLQENMSLQIIQTIDCRVIGIDFSKSYRQINTDTDKNKDRAFKEANRQTSKCIGQVIFYFHIIRKIIQEKQIIYYAIINGNNGQEAANQAIKKAQQFIQNDKIRYILCEYETVQNERKSIQRLFIDGENKLMSKFTTIEIFEKNQKVALLSEFIERKINISTSSPNKNNDSNQKKAKLSQIRIQTSHCQRLILNPISKIIRNTEQKHQELNANLYQQKIKEVVNFIKYAKLQQNYNQQQFHNLKTKKLDQSLAYKYFITRIIKLKNKYKGLENNKPERIMNLKKFFMQIVCQIYNAFSEISQKQIRCLYKYVCYLLQINQYLVQIDPNIAPMYDTLIQTIKLSSEIQQNMAKIVTKLNIQYGKQPSYYQNYLQIVQSFDDIKWRKEPDQILLVDSLKQIKNQLPIIYKIELLSHQQGTKQTICSIIKQIFNQYSENKQLKSYKLNLFLRGFNNSAKKLQSFGLPELAIELYKKLKFINKIEECIKQIIFKENGKRQKREIYLQISNYFYSIGEAQRASYYADLAFQNSSHCEDIQIQQAFYKMIQMKKKILKNQSDINCKEAKLVDSLSNHEIQIKMYFDYEVTQQFKEKINILETLVQDSEIDTNVEIQKEKLSQIQVI